MDINSNINRSPDSTLRYDDLLKNGSYCCSYILQIFRSAIKSKVPAKGQGLVEYALILVLVAVVVIVVMSLLGPLINRIFGTISCALQGPTDMMTCFETPEPPPAP